jgi:hypothetical protein
MTSVHRHRLRAAGVDHQVHGLLRRMGGPAGRPQALSRLTRTS